MKSQKTTKDNTTRIVANVDQPLLEKIDAERIQKGSCSRAVIIRMALLDRYRTQPSTL